MQSRFKVVELTEGMGYLKAKEVQENCVTVRRRAEGRAEQESGALGYTVSS